MTTEKTFSPFHSGSQYADWTCSNCDHCKKYNYEDHDKSCDIDQALLFACMDDGKVTMDIAKRMNAIKYKDHFNWPCGELETDDNRVKESIEAFSLKYAEK